MATTKDLIVDSGSTDVVMVNTQYFKNLKEIDTTVTSLDGDNKPPRNRRPEVLAKDVKKRIKPLILRKALFVLEYRTNLISVSSIVDKGHKIVHEAKNCFFTSNLKRNSVIKKERFDPPYGPKRRD